MSNSHHLSQPTSGSALQSNFLPLDAGDSSRNWPLRHAPVQGIETKKDVENSNSTWERIRLPFLDPADVINIES